MNLVKYDAVEVGRDLSKEKSSAQRAIDKLQALTIEDEGDKQKAGAWLVEAKKRKKSFIESKLYQSHKNVASAIRLESKEFKVLVDQYDDAIKILNKKIVAYDAQKLLESREEERLIRHEQEQEAERERAAIQEQAEEAERQGDLELFEELKADAKTAGEVVPFVGRPARATKVEGTIQRTTWKAEVVNLDALPIEFCKPKVADAALLNAHARKYEDKAKVDGVRFYKDTKYV